MDRADLREPVVLEVDNATSDVPGRRVPELVDAEDLDVDALRIHFEQSLGTEDQRRRIGPCAAYQIKGVGDDTVRVDVDRLNAAPPQGDGPADGRRRRLSGVAAADGACQHASGRQNTRFDRVPATDSHPFTLPRTRAF